MLRAAFLVVLALAEAPIPTVPAVKGVPQPPEASFETELTKLATERAQAEMKTALAMLERDPGRPEAWKREIKEKLSRFRLAFYTSARSLDELVFFYERALGGTFVFAERDILTDLREAARLAGAPLDPAVEREWQGKRGRSARWSRDDGTLEIDLEDHLIDPRDGKVTRKSVVLISTVAP